MGCCDNEKGCSSKGKPKRSIPWFGLIVVGLVVLVALNWQ